MDANMNEDNQDQNAAARGMNLPVQVVSHVRTISKFTLNSRCLLL